MDAIRLRDAMDESGPVDLPVGPGTDSMPAAPASPNIGGGMTVPPPGGTSAPGGASAPSAPGPTRVP
jgi:hypothetical protein